MGLVCLGTVYREWGIGRDNEFGGDLSFYVVLYLSSSVGVNRPSISKTKQGILPEKKHTKKRSSAGPCSV